MRRRACCHALPRPPFCTCGGDWHKHWVAGTFSPIGQLACSCDHPAGAHQQIAGVRTESSQFFSRSTAEYRKNLLNHLVRLFCHYFQIGSWNLIWITLSTICQSNRLMTPIFETRWGRIPYQSARHSFEDCSSTLRKKIFSWAPSRRQNEPPFSPEQLRSFKAFLDEFLLAQGIQPDWSVPGDQQLCLYILQQLCSCMQDPDTCFLTWLKVFRWALTKISNHPSAFPFNHQTLHLNHHCFPFITRIGNLQKTNLPLSWNSYRKR